MPSEHIDLMAHSRRTIHNTGSAPAHDFDAGGLSERLKDVSDQFLVALPVEVVSIGNRTSRGFIDQLTIRHIDSVSHSTPRAHPLLELRQSPVPGCDESRGVAGCDSATLGC